MGVYKISSPVLDPEVLEDLGGLTGGPGEDAWAPGNQEGTIGNREMSKATGTLGETAPAPSPPSVPGTRRSGRGRWPRSSARAWGSRDPARGDRWRRCCCGRRGLAVSSCARNFAADAGRAESCCPIALGVPAATIAARESGRHDPGFVVIDEVAGQWIALLGCPRRLAPCADRAGPVPALRHHQALPGAAVGAAAGGLGHRLRRRCRGVVCLGCRIACCASGFGSEHAAMPRSAPNPLRHFPSPALTTSCPAAALPLGEVELTGSHLGPHNFGPPAVLVDGAAAHVLDEPARAPGFPRARSWPPPAWLKCARPHGASNAVPLRVARELTAGLHPVTSPAVSRSGMIYATISGQRGKATPVSVVRVSPDGRGTPFVTGHPERDGTGLQRRGRSVCDLARRGHRLPRGCGGRITRSTPKAWAWPPARRLTARAISLWATAAEPSSRSIPSARFLCMPRWSRACRPITWPSNRAGTLFVTGPTLSSNDAIWAIEPNGDTRAWYRGLGRPQGLALARDGSVYVAACLHGQPRASCASLPRAKPAWCWREQPCGHRILAAWDRRSGHQ